MTEENMRERISAVVGGIDERHVREAADYTPEARHLRWRHILPRAAAAALALCLLAGGMGLLGGSGGGAVAVYAHDSGEALTAAGAELHTGTIGDDGEMTGHPLQFYLTGEDIESVRFSCERQRLSFTDWTEQRAGYGLVQNFTVPYGGDAEDYYYLLVDWEPTETIRALTDHADTAIATLPEALRRDRIVLEITFADGSTAVKCIEIRLLDNGHFFASLRDYTITGEDAFVRRSDAESIPAGGGDGAETPDVAPCDLSEGALNAARAAAEEYYRATVFTLESLSACRRTETGVVFTARVSRGGVPQEPDRSIWLRPQDGGWVVENEGY